ncbi:MAG TPA: YfhO family protein [Candidatus Saccharimonadales bacterium]|nr:YfhO family protein [Candidatus Saccharimonadales bacterium]
MAFAKTSTSPRRDTRGFLIFFGCLLLVLGVMFARSFQSGYVHFSNDGPLGVQKSACNAVTDSVNGQWNDLYWVGFYGGSAPINLNSALSFLLGPVGFAKFLAPLSMLILGLCAWVFFRQIKLSPMLCILGGLAAALNSNFFSNVCWGLGSRALTAGMIFLALAAVTNVSGRWGWIRLPLAGLAVGMSIMDGADNGAIFSLYVAAYALFVALTEEGAGPVAFLKGLSRTAIVAIFAGIMATQVLISVLGTQVAGIKQMESAEQRWDFATQWSLPGNEMFRVIIPGLFGYRMDTEEGGQYWGKVGQSPGYEQHPGGLARFSGAGEYAGVLVILIGLWAIAHSTVGGSKTYSLKERRLIWFWSIMALLSALFALGRYAPFYRIVFSLPYFSTIRNPIKFMHPFHVSFMILFGYGLLGMSRRYFENVALKPLFLTDQVKSWWSKATTFEKRWTFGSLGAVALSILGWMVYAGSRKSVERYIASPAFDNATAANPTAALQMAQQITSFSLQEVGWYILFLILSVGAVILIMSGSFAGKRARQALIVLGFILVVDLCRANAPWTRFYDYREKYASNPVLNILKDKPWEHRVSMPPFQVDRNFFFLQQFYNVEWLQHHFAFYNVQSLDIPQEPRMPADKAAYRQALGNNLVRLWELTNTRFVFGLGGNFVDTFNQQLDPVQKRFRVNTYFDVLQGATGSGFLVQTNTSGAFALIDFTGALPRAQLYTQWQVQTNDEALLKELARPEFDPHKVVLVNAAVPPPAQAPVGDPGKVEITSYSPKLMKLRYEAASPSILLLNDKYDPGWKAYVEGKAAPVLKCNFLMQGVQVPSGAHNIEMRFEPPIKGLYVSLLALLAGLSLSGILIFTGRRFPVTDPVRPAPQPELQKK